VDHEDSLSLRAVVRASGGEQAWLRLGADPGGFFCGALFADLLMARREGLLAAQTCVGFLHVPPDQACSAAAAASPRLCSRAVNLEMIGRVLGSLLCRDLLVGPQDRRVLITGFGPFEGVCDNPTAAFVGDAGAIDSMIALASPEAARSGRREAFFLEGEAEAADAVSGWVDRFRAAEGAQTIEVVTGLLPLAREAREALAGRYRPLAEVEAGISALLAAARAAGPLDAVISLGVDSGQIAGDGAEAPVFKVETQTWGWQRGRERGRSSSAEPQRCFDLGAIVARARARGDVGLVRWER
jgi:hypothetical protein